MYDEGFRHSCTYFAAFCLRNPDVPDGPKVGFTVPRALGKAVIRNRLKRRMREAVRLHLKELPAAWWVVVNPRKAALDADFTLLEAEVQRLFQRCATS